MSSEPSVESAESVAIATEHLLPHIPPASGAERPDPVMDLIMDLIMDLGRGVAVD